ncbi:MAG: hypothetical protein HY554_12680, partial [Elusimicrobia bacterium]|nr:hypothetical protein [Elusimicrobiota bacterium]
MLWALSFLTALSFGELARFCSAEARKRRRLDAAAFPADPAKPARLSLAVLQDEDRAEFLSGARFLIRANLALSALAASALWWALGRGAWGLAAGRPVGACVAVALGGVQCLVLVPAAAASALSGAAGSFRGLLFASAPFFALAGAGGLWLVWAGPPARPAAPAAPVQASAAPSQPLEAASIAVPGGSRYSDGVLSCLRPSGWEAEAQTPERGVYRLRLAPVRADGETEGAQLLLRFWGADNPFGETADTFLDSLLARDRSTVPFQVRLSTLGGVAARS